MYVEEETVNNTNHEARGQTNDITYIYYFMQSGIATECANKTS